ncbi:hypothetical protein ABPG74_011002 [Tetrahymena malaccensis]
MIPTGNLESLSKKRKIPHLVIKEGDEGWDQMTGYAKCQKYFGDCCGCLRTWIPCVFCCCVEYPYMQVRQFSSGLITRFGKYVRQTKPGLIYVNPCTDKLIQVDMRLQVIDLDKQSILTKDNVVVTIDATVYFRVKDPKLAIFRIENYQLAIEQLTYSCLKNTCGQYVLQDLFDKREEISSDLRIEVDKYTDEWGIDVENILIKDIALSQDLQQSLSSAARERRLASSKLIQAQADVESAKLMKEASNELNSKAAMQIRYLETIKMISQQGARVIFLPKDDDQDRMRHRITQGLMS